jgi:hypothetical protein
MRSMGDHEQRPICCQLKYPIDEVTLNLRIETRCGVIQ